MNGRFVFQRAGIQMYTYFHSRCFDGQEGTGRFASGEFIYAQGDVPICSEG